MASNGWDLILWTVPHLLEVLNPCFFENWALWTWPVLTFSCKAKCSMFKCCNLLRQHKAAFKKYKCMCWTSDFCLGYRRQFLYYYQIQSWISTYLLDSYWKYQDERFIQLFFFAVFYIFCCQAPAEGDRWLLSNSSSAVLVGGCI